VDADAGRVWSFRSVFGFLPFPIISLFLCDSFVYPWLMSIHHRVTEIHRVPEET